MPVRQIIPTERQEEQASPAQDTDQRESVQQEGDALLADSETAIEQALSVDSEAFLQASRQRGGQ